MPMPKIPHHKKGLNISSNLAGKEKEDHNKSMEIDKSKELELSSHKYSKSMVDMNELRKVKMFYESEPPSKKQYRKID